MCLQSFVVNKICEFRSTVAEIFTSYRGTKIENYAFYLVPPKKRNARALYVIFEADWDKFVENLMDNKSI